MRSYLPISKSIKHLAWISTISFAEALDGKQGIRCLISFQPGSCNSSASMNSRALSSRSSSSSPSISKSANRISIRSSRFESRRSMYGISDLCISSMRIASLGFMVLWRCGTTQALTRNIKRPMPRFFRCRFLASVVGWRTKSDIRIPCRVSHCLSFRSTLVFDSSVLFKNIR